MSWTSFWMLFQVNGSTPFTFSDTGHIKNMTIKSLFDSLLCIEQNKLQKIALIDTSKVNNQALVAQGMSSDDILFSSYSSDYHTTNESPNLSGSEVDREESDIESLVEEMAMIVNIFKKFSRQNHKSEKTGTSSSKFLKTQHDI